MTVPLRWLPPLLLAFAPIVLAQELPEAAPPAEEEPSAPTIEAAPVEEEASDEADGGIAPGAPTIDLRAAVRLALERNYGILGSADNVASARYREKAAFSEFLPQVTPRVGRVEGTTTFGVDVAQRLPWSGGTLSANGLVGSNSSTDAPLGQSSAVRAQLTQPLLRGAGPGSTYYDLRNSRRAVETQERSFELFRQRLAIQVTAAFYGVVAQRQLVVVSRQSWKRTLALQKASEARLKVGLASKLDVFRAELQASQTQEALIRQQSALQSALEQFRALLALSPSDPLEPEAVALPEQLPTESEPVETIVARAFANRLEIKEARAQVDDSKRNLAIARQNLLPQLDLNLAYSRQGTAGSYGDAWRIGDDRFLFGFTTSYPLERQGEKTQAAVATLDLAQRERGALQREQEVEADVRSAARELERIRKSFELQRKSVEAAAQQQRLASLRYQRGLASNFDVVDAEGSLLFARSALVSLLVSYKVAEVELLRATGAFDVDKEYAQ